MKIKKQFQLNPEDFKRLALWQGISIISENQAAVLSKIIKKHQPKKILEIGTGVGFSLSQILISAPKTVEITSIEYSHYLWQTNNKIFQNQIKSGRIRLVRSDAFKFLLEANEKFNFIFLDASSSDYASFLALLEDLLVSGSIIIARIKKGNAFSAGGYLENIRKHKTEVLEFENEYFFVSQLA